MKKIILATLFLATAAWAQALDGKHFSGKMGEKGKSGSMKEEIDFEKGSFHSRACDSWGFDGAGYRLSDDGGVTRFEADTTSVKEGRMHWSGTIKGDAIEGVATWMKAGQKPIDYWFTGTLKK